MLNVFPACPLMSLIWFIMWQVFQQIYTHLKCAVAIIIIKFSLKSYSYQGKPFLAPNKFVDAKINYFWISIIKSVFSHNTVEDYFSHKVI